MFAQQVVIQGQVNSLSANFSPRSNSSVFYKYQDEDSVEQIEAIPVNQHGIFQQFLPAQTWVQLYIYYNNFLPIDTVIFTEDVEVIRLNFHIKPKDNHFDPARAQKDIASGKVRIIFHDLEMYRLFRKANFQQKYGFHFEYVPRPESWQEMRSISEYNAEMERFLDTQNGENWRNYLYEEMDSLIEVRESYAGLETVPQMAQVEITEELPHQLDGNPTQGAITESASSAADPQVVALDDPLGTDAIAMEDGSGQAEIPALPESKSKGLMAFKNTVISSPVDPKSLVPTLEFEWESDELAPTLPLHVLEPPITTEEGPEIFLPVPEPTPTAPLATVIDTTPVRILPQEAPAEEGITLQDQYQALPSVSEIPPSMQGPNLALVVAVPNSPKTPMRYDQVRYAFEAETSVPAPTEPVEAPVAVVETPVEVLENSSPETSTTDEEEGFYPTQPNSILGHLEAMQQKVLEEAIQKSKALYGTAKLSKCPPSWRFPEAVPVGSKMAQRIEDQQQYYHRFYEGKMGWKTEAPVAFILEKIENDPSYQHLKVVEKWSSLHYQALIPELIFRLTQVSKVGLTDAEEIIIWDRVDSGDLIVTGPGAEIEDDLFMVAGRANYLLQNLTGENFGPASMGASEKELIHLRDHWINWLLQQQSLSQGAIR